MAIKQPRNADIITKGGQFGQQWPRYFDQIEARIDEVEAAATAAAAAAAAAADDKRIYAWTALDANVTGFGFAATADTRSQVPVLDFPDSGIRAFTQCGFTGVIPSNYVTGTAIDFELHFSMASATTGTAYWAVRFAPFSGENLDTFSFDGNPGNPTTVPATAGIVTSTVITQSGSNLQSAAAGEFFRVIVTYEAAASTATGDAELIAVEARRQ